MALKIALLFCLLSPVIKAKEILTYDIKSNDNNLLLKSVTIDTSHLGHFVLNPSRAIPSTNTSEVKCHLSNQVSKIEFEKETKCDIVSWDISFKPLDINGIDISSQQNVYSSSGHWILFEWGDIHRIKGIVESQVCINGKSCSPIPTMNQAPLIKVWGGKPILISNHLFEANIYADDILLGSKKNAINEKMSKLITYLRPIFNTQNGPVNWDLIFVNIDERYKTVGGAAGYNSWVVNYVTNNGKLNEQRFEHTAHLVAHETIHTLTDIPLSFWVSESLTEYYTHKAFRLIEPTYESAIEELIRKQDAQGDLSKKIGEVEPSNENLLFFYTKGAAFWQAIDEQLAKNNSSLDDLVDTLANYESDELLPESFIKKLVGIIGSFEAQKIIREYVQENSTHNLDS